ncbi:NAD(P)/FAD-dependent oxidoreductase [Calycomorphotria hydatis]|uniref:FAD-dependent oxidoreductase LodB n=1 Tax=Calycomorphotria hydatis TaxID=2528027 RepID=A0A517T9K0_9PLAN|nr:NAD(P)/FAD-dependent oxidoreductase [Calycomorphotria hydatis]QDT65060.1 Putative FAD-dependent oxidoreductase LodB [Calycomorphotria hydatis]
MIKTTPTLDDGPQPEIAESYDVIVVGGGPAGAAAAAIVAEGGYSVLLLERHAIPRFHVGESLIPETYWPLKRLGLLEQLKASAFPRKFSVQFINDSGRESAPFYFDQHKGCESSVTWQVERGVFDKMLIDNAVEKGATLRTDAHVMDVLWDGDRAAGVKVRLGRNTEREIREIKSTILIDATGQSAFMANRLGIKDSDPHLKKGTIWTYWKDATRPEDPRDNGATLIVSGANKNTWFWFIPISDEITSIGCTGNMDHMFGKHRLTAEDTFMDEVARCPGINSRLENATRATDFFTTKDFSYYSRQGSGDGWMLIGDAFGFIDPVYSSGVFLALQSGEYGGDAAVAALKSGDSSGQALGQWQTNYKNGVENFRRLVYAFYSPDFSIGGFLKEYPQHRDGIVEVLIGDVFKDHSQMFGDMQQSLPELQVV